MKIVAKYDFNGGKQAISQHYSNELNEIIEIIKSIDCELCKTKTSLEKTMPGKVLYSPKALNTEFKRAFRQYGWGSHKILCEYQFGEYLEGYISSSPSNVRPFREMDFLKRDKKLGIEVQFGKYAFMVYNVCAKMTIFNKLGIIDTGIEIVPVKRFVDEMSTGVSYFEQFAWDLHQRGISNIDIPVLILGIDR